MNAAVMKPSLAGQAARLIASWRAQARRWPWPVWVAAALLAGSVLLVAWAVPWQARQLESLRSQADEARRTALREERPARAPASTAQALRNSLPSAGLRQPRVAALLALAAAQGLELRRSEFRYASEARLGVARYRVTLPLEGSYEVLRRFIEEALQSDTALLLDSVQLRRDTPQAAQLRAELAFSFLMQAETAP